ncbi:MAG: PspA/IM30 family protein [Spirochaetes bacterium]|nr:PspA/IM30 family protein [Spirochaetota bacterium]
MGLFQRFRRVLSAQLNHLLSKAEQPEKMLNQLVLDMNRQLMEVKKSVAAAIADEKRLERQLITYIEQANEWERKAILAVREQRDDLAKEALLRKQEIEGLILQQKNLLVSQHEAVEKLKLSLRDLQKKVEEAQRRKNILIARAKRAETAKRMQETMGAISDTSSFEAFERMAAKVDQIEAEVEALSELETSFSDSRLENQFRQLEQSSQQDTADKLLADLKRKLLEEKS